MEATIHTASQLKRQRRKETMKRFFKDPVTVIAVVLLFIFLAVFAVYPIVKVFLSAVYQDGQWDFTLVKETLANPTFRKVFANTMKLGLTTSIIATVVGYIYAYGVTRTTLPGKKFLHFMALVPMISPPFAITLAIVLLFGRNGFITSTVLGIENYDVYGFKTLVVIQTLSYFTLSYLNTRGALESIDSSVENAAINLGSTKGQVFRKITLPLTMPSVFSSLLLTFIKSIEDFSNPTMIGGNYRTLATESYMQITGMYDIPKGSLIAISLLVPSLIAFLIQRYWISKRSFVTVTGKPTGEGQLISDKKVVIPLGIIVYSIVGFTLLLYGSVVVGSFLKNWGVNNTLTLDNYRYVFSRGFDSLKDSLILALIAGLAIAIIGMVASYVLIRKEFIGKRLLEIFAIIPYAIPGTVIGIGYIVSFNQKPLELTGTALIIILAFIVQNLNVGVQAGQNALRQVDNSIEEASTMLGASTQRSFLKIDLPLMRSGLITAFTYGFVSSMTSVSAVIFLVSVNWKLITTTIMSQAQQFQNGRAAAYVVVLMMIILLVLGVFQLLVNMFTKKKQAN